MRQTLSRAVQPASVRAPVQALTAACAPAAAVENEHMRHLSQCARLPLAQCTEQEFEEDLYTFLTHRGEVELANDLRNKRINWCARPRAPPEQCSCGSS